MSEYDPAGSVENPVLVVSTTVDLATDRVVDHLLKADVPVIRLNTEFLPYSESITFRPGQPLSHKGTHYCHKEIRPRSVWYRRIRSCKTPSDVEDSLHDYTMKETYWFLRGALCGMQAGHRWMNKPAAVENAEQKPLQLAIAKELGLTIPDTIITSDPSEVASFYNKHGGVLIAKPVRSGFVKHGGQGYAMYTSRLSSDDIEALPDSLPCPIIIQNEIQKRADIRVTVVDDALFVAEIDSQSDPAAQVDWRRTDNPDLPHMRHELPVADQERCLSLMRKLDLQFGAIDLVWSSDGTYVFLEVNPSGQWLWIEDQLDFPISSTIAGWLAGATA